MRPLGIEVQGFTAFRDLQKIDLRELGLFVITGPTGSGKSSFLDAMIFALYGRVPRAGKHGMKDLISQGLVEARVQLEFSVEGQAYRIARRLSRTQPQSATLERADGEDWRSAVDGSGVRVVDDRIVELLKLSYEAFTRAVVLPQGDFHQFLRGDTGERREILSKLLGLGHYEKIAQRARARSNELKTKTDARDGIIEAQFGDVNESANKGLSKQSNAAGKRADALSAALTTAQGIEIKHDALVATVGRVDLVGSDITEIAVLLAEQRASHGKDQERQRELATAVSAAEKRLQTADAQVTTANEALSKAIATCGTLEDLARLLEAVETSAAAQQECLEQVTKLDGLHDQLKAAGSAAVSAQTEKARTAEALGVAERQEAAAREENDTRQVAQASAESRVASAEQAATELRTETATGTVVATALENAERDAERASAARSLAAEALETLVTADHAAALAVGLNVGDPCPVCDRPLSEHPTVEPRARDNLGGARSEWQAAEKAHQKAADAFATERQRQVEATQRLSGASARLAQALGDASDVTQLRAEAKTLRASSKEAQNTLAAATANVTEGRSQYEAASENAVSNEAAAAALKESIALVKDAVSKAEGRRDRATERLAAHFNGALPEDAAQRIEQERGQVREAQAATENTRSAVTEARRERDDVVGQLAEVRQRLADSHAAIAGLRARCDAVTVQLGAEVETFEGALTISPLGPQPDDGESHVNQLDDWCAAMSEVVTTARETAAKISARVEKELEKLLTKAGVSEEDGDSAASALRREQEAAVALRAQLTEQAEQMARRLEQRKELEAESANQREQVEVLGTLITELRADRFVGFILQETLDELALRASDELMRISDERYSLVSGDGTFAVVDHINADEQRSVNTLSGGETFLASLALALALSQHIGDLATEGIGAKLEAVFIDEGFGTLDAETLEDVIDALERLHESDLLVGVISHVPELAERIKAGLRIEKNQGRSTVSLATAA